MVEVKADALEQSFEAFEDEDDGVAALKAELETLKAKIAAGAIAAQRPALDGVKSAEASSFVDQYLRRGIESGLETKAIGSSTDAIGGYAVPRGNRPRDRRDADGDLADPRDRQCREGRQRRLSQADRERRNAVGLGRLTKRRGRRRTRRRFTEIVPAAGELYANPAASQQMLDDAMFDVEKWLAHEIATEFARAEGAAFVSGTGVNQPLGFLSSPDAATRWTARGRWARCSRSAPAPPARSRRATRRTS